MTASSALCEIDFLFALVEEPIKDMVRLAFTVRPDDTWVVQVGRHPSLGPGVDSTLHTITGDATTSASDLLRMLAQRIMAPHETSPLSVERPS